MPVGEGFRNIAIGIPSAFSANMVLAALHAHPLGIIGADPAATVTTTTDANDNLTVTNNGAWGAIKNVTINSAVNGNVTVNNFVDAQISLGNGDSTITANDAMRGTISVGNGDDTISVVAESNASVNNMTSITAGDGADHISFLARRTPLRR
jgi:hypothetical protein